MTSSSISVHPLRTPATLPTTTPATLQAITLTEDNHLPLSVSLLSLLAYLFTLYHHPFSPFFPPSPHRTRHHTSTTDDSEPLSASSATPLIGHHHLHILSLSSPLSSFSIFLSFSSLATFYP